MADLTNQSQQEIARPVADNKEINRSSNSGEIFIGVWLDENSERMDSDVYVNLKRDLENTFDFLRTFIKPWECIGYLDEIKNGKILFLVSHDHACVVMKLIEGANLPQIHSIYVVCSNDSELDDWNSTDFRKLRGGFFSKTELMQQIKNDIKNIHTNTETSDIGPTPPSTQDTTNERLKNAVPAISVFNSEPKNNSIKHLNKDSIWFIRHQLFLEILLKLKKSSTAADEMIYVCKRLYEGDETRLKQILEFEQDVEDAFKSVYWYTKVSFIVHLLNKKCGSQDFHDIYPFRLFINNLHSELVQLDKNHKENPLEDTITVFRGKYIALSTFEKLKKNKNSLVAMNGFLSTTRNETVARFFINDGAPKTGYIAVLFKLNIGSKVINKPYADIPSDRHGTGPDEEELLFSIGSVWQITDVNELTDDQNQNTKMWCVELTLSNQDDEQSKLLNDYRKREIGEEVNNWTLGDFLTKTRQYKQAETYYDLLKCALPKTDENLAIINNRIAYVRYEDGDYTTALIYLQKAMTHTAKDGEAEVVVKFSRQTTDIEASVAARCAPALRHQLENGDIIIKYLLSNPLLLPILQNNVGCVYHKKGVFDRALECYKDALNILLQNESSFLPEISAIYNNIGAIQYHKNNCKDAAENFRQAITALLILRSDSPHKWIDEYTKNYQTACGYVDSNKSKRPRTQ